MTESRGTTAMPIHPKPTESAVHKGRDQGAMYSKTVECHEGAANECASSVPIWKGPEQDMDATASGENPFNKTDAALSPVAPTFQPADGKTNQVYGDNESHVVVVSSKPARVVNGSKNANEKVIQEVVDSVGDKAAHNRPQVYFTTDIGPGVPFLGSHYIKVDKLVKVEFGRATKTMCYDYGWQAKMLGQAAPPAVIDNEYMVWYVCFDDIRDAEQACRDVKDCNPSWETIYVNQAEYASMLAKGNGKGPESSTFDGQVIFVVEIKGHGGHSTNEDISDCVYNLAVSFGDVLALDELDGCPPDEAQFRVEYLKISSAKEVLIETAAQPKNIGNLVVYAVEVPEASDWFDSATSQRSSSNPDINATPHKGVNGALAGHYSSPSGRTAWRFNDKGEAVPMQPSKQLPKTVQAAAGSGMPQPYRPRYESAPLPQPLDFYPEGHYIAPRSESFNGPYGGHQAGSKSSFGSLYDPFQSRDLPTEPQQVIVWRIENGQDVRTTIMLRNLPNGMTYRFLKKMLDSTSFGKYDFSYLRIDFSQNKNVGYGFVNFTDPMHIVGFLKKYANKSWFHHHRGRGNQRMADFRYATVQGYECIVEKFRNSAIMDEFPDYRPKLWFTYETALSQELIGTERPFPGVNNASKKQRSADNAANIGLYAPNHRGMNGGSRHRHSQYDRGTTAQIQDDAYFNQMVPMHHGYSYNNADYALVPAPLVVGPPAPFPMAYGHQNGFNGYGAYPNPYLNNAPPLAPQPYHYGQFSNIEPFRTNSGFGASGNVHVPASRLRTASKGQLAGRPRHITTAPQISGPAQGPANGYQNELYTANDHNGSGASARVPKVFNQGNNGSGVDHEAFCSSNGQKANTYGRSFRPQF